MSEKMLDAGENSENSENSDVQTKIDEREDEESGRVSVLRGCFCCQRCVLRFLGRRTVYIYTDPSQTCPSLWKSDHDVNCKNEETSKGRPTEEIASSSESLEEMRRDKKTCPACLGILQNMCDEDFIKKICGEVKELNYDFNAYMLSMTLPLQLEIRQHCLLTHLNEVCRSVLKSSDITPIKDVFKWVCGPMMSQHLHVSFSPKSPFEVGLIFHHEETKVETGKIFDEISDKEPANKKRRFTKHSSQRMKGGPTRQMISTALRSISSQHLKRLLSHPPVVPQTTPSYVIECLHEPVHVAGRYTKHSRHLSQTPWILDGERKTESSVEEHICKPIKESLRAADYRFSSSGREDVDVRTLGRGRPFVVEIVNPRKNVFCEEDFKQLQQDINGRTNDVGVRDLQLVGRDATMWLKEGETEKKKSYMALVKVDKAIKHCDLESLQTLQDLVLQQKTPLRVLHRRPLATRERTIHTISAEKLDEHHFNLFLCTQAGTYIKEFVHGDLGRTQPNIGSLLDTEADIIELDVTAVHVDWPKKIDDLD